MATATANISGIIVGWTSTDESVRNFNVYRLTADVTAAITTGDIVAKVGHGTNHFIDLGVTGPRWYRIKAISWAGKSSSLSNAISAEAVSFSIGGSTSDLTLNGNNINIGTACSTLTFEGKSINISSTGDVTISASVAVDDLTASSAMHSLFVELTASNNPPTPNTGGMIRLYAKDTAGSTVLCTIDTAGTVAQIGDVAAHATTHTDGTDDIQNATDGQKGLMTSTDHSTLTDLSSTDSRAKAIVGSLVHSANAPTSTTKNEQPALSFTTGVDCIVYFEPLIVPSGFNTATLKLRYAMSTSEANDVVLKWTPRTNGSAGAEDTLTQTTDADQNEHTYDGTTLQIAGLSEGDILGGKFYRDGDNANDTHGGNFLLILAWIEWSSA